jgi:hypothetical protein
MGLEDIFPNLHGSAFRVTSPIDDSYNCVAWAMGRTDGWWWPLGDPKKSEWPAGVARVESLEAFSNAFSTLGYSSCELADPEPGNEKIAIYATPDGIPTHGARQMVGGRWTSKLGGLEDIEHGLNDLIGTEYGSIAQVMMRPTG